MAFQIKTHVPLGLVFFFLLGESITCFTSDTLIKEKKVIRAELGEKNFPLIHVLEPHRSIWCPHDSVAIEAEWETVFHSATEQLRGSLLRA